MAEKFKIKNCREGFTMIEILLVMAIISILSTIVFASIGNQRQRARLANATSSVKSATTIATTCHAMGGDISNPGVDNRDGDGKYICSGVMQVDNVLWPKLPESCSYCGKNGTKIMFQCTKDGKCSGSEPDYSSCDFNNSKCVQI